MSTTKYVLLGALGVAAVLLLTTDKGKKLRGDFTDLAKDNAKKWKKNFGKMGSTASDAIDDLKEMLSSEIEGLSDDARERIEAIVHGSAKTAAKVKKAAANHA